MKKTGIVTAVVSRSVNTKFGVRSTHSITVDGESYQVGFGKITTNMGDPVQFDFEETKYGKEITKGTLLPLSSLAVAATPLVPVAEVVNTVLGPVTRYVPKNTGERKFPIDALSPERAIIRQNALTQARELLVGTHVDSGIKRDWTERQKQLDTLSDEVIRLARKFEAYAAGDIDVAEVKAEMKAEDKATIKRS